MEITKYEYEFLKSIVDRYEKKNDIRHRYSYGSTESKTIREYFESKDSFPISVRLFNILYSHTSRGNMGDISRMTRNDFGRLRNFGKVTMKEVERMFEFLGWELRPR